MNALIDFSPIKNGGGAQLALNFIKNIGDLDFFDEIYILVSKKFPHTNSIPSSCRVVVSPVGYLHRVIYENVNLRALIRKNKIKLIYTFFGPGLPPYKGVRQIVSVAYPIICNDDSPYWNYLPKKEYYRKKILNYYRKSRLKKADFLIFETEVMRRRCVKVLGINEQCTKVIPPSVTDFLSAKKKVREPKTTFLFLSGLDYHKNLWRIPELLKLAKRKKLEFRIVISVDKHEYISFYSKYVNIDFQLLDEYVFFVGKIPSDEIQSVYDISDVVVNISDLESFSNNYMESWLAKKPIIASDRDFSRNICGDSAFYVEPHDIESVFSGFEYFSNNYTVYDSSNRLDLLPTVTERIELLRKVFLL